MGEITEIDLFVHPLFSCSKKPWKSGTYSKEDAKKRMVQLNARILELRLDKRHILIYLSNTLKKKDFSLITNSDLNRIPAYLSDERQIAEATLIRYVEHQLINWYFDRAFFFEDNPNFFFNEDKEDDDLKKIGERIAPKHATVWVHGEQDGDCVSKACAALSASLGIPRKNFKFSKTLSGNKGIKGFMENTEKITKIDLLVHPFFNYCPNWLSTGDKDEYWEEEAGIMMKVWKGSVDDVQADTKRRMIFLGHTTRQKFFETMKTGKLKEGGEYIAKDLLFTKNQLEEKFKKETELLKYAYERLGSRLLYLHGSITGNADKIEQFLPEPLIDAKNIRLNVYGEALTSCVIKDEAVKLARCMPMPLKRYQVRIQPKKSVDWTSHWGKPGYPRLWKIPEIKKREKKERDAIMKDSVSDYRRKRKDLYQKLFGD